MRAGAVRLAIETAATGTGSRLRPVCTLRPMPRQRDCRQNA